MPSPSTNSTEEARRVLREASTSVARLADALDETFERVVEIVCESSHHVVVSGAGKSGLIAKKIAATLASTGTPAVHLHAGDAAHGDLGIVVPGSVCILVSYSGTTKEVLELSTALRRIGCVLVAITGNPSSQLARRSDFVLDIGVRTEAGPYGLAPTTSTTVTLALGDALAVAAAVARGFTDRDFARNHPGGPLGALLLVRLSDVLIMGDDLPVVSVDARVQEVIVEIMKKRLGMTLVEGPAGDIVGIVTDGDLRRGMLRGELLFGSSCADVMTRDPVSMNEGELGSTALRLMREKRITSLLVHRADGHYGVVTMHGLLDVGLTMPGPRASPELPSRRPGASRDGAPRPVGSPMTAAGRAVAMLSNAREGIASGLRRIRSAARDASGSTTPPESERHESGRIVAFIDDDAAARTLMNDPSIVIVCTSFDAAYELRAAGANNVRCLADYAPKHASFDSLFAEYARVVHARLGPAGGAGPAAKALFEIVFPDFVRKFGARFFVADAMRAALRMEDATFVAVRANDADIDKLAELVRVATAQ